MSNGSHRSSLETALGRRISVFKIGELIQFEHVVPSGVCYVPAANTDELCFVHRGSIVVRTHDGVARVFWAGSNVRLHDAVTVCNEEDEEATLIHTFVFRPDSRSGYQDMFEQLMGDEWLPFEPNHAWSKQKRLQHRFVVSE